MYRAIRKCLEECHKPKNATSGEAGDLQRASVSVIYGICLNAVSRRAPGTPQTEGIHLWHSLLVAFPLEGVWELRAVSFRRLDLPHTF
jgi:hypothetical protein